MNINTPDQLIQTIYNSISKSTIDSMQLSQNQAISSQRAVISCDDQAVAFMTDQTTRCIKELKKKGFNDINIKKLCNSPIKCNATNISIKSSLNITDLINQTASIKANIENSLSSNITQDLNSLNTSLLLGSNADKMIIKEITDLVAENIADITQEVYNTVKQEQSLILNNYIANNITISNVSTIVGNIVQNIDGMSDLVTTISNDIIQQLSVNTDSLTTWVRGIMIIGMSIVVILFLILFVLKRKDTRDFIEFITPYVLFLIGVLVIMAVHLIVKPPYIMNDKDMKYKEINRDRFIFWCTFFSILLCAFEIIYFKLIKKKT